MLNPASKQISDCQQNLYAFWKALARPTSHQIIEDDQYLVTPTHCNNPVLNPVHRFPFFKPSFTHVKEELLQRLGIKTSLSWWHDSSLHSEQTLSELQANCQFHIGPVPVMWFDLTKNLPEPSKHVVAKWPDAKNLNGFIKPISECFNLLGQDELIYQRGMEANHAQLTHFYVEKDHAIVGVGSLFLNEGVAGFYNLAVLPPYRHQGIATAIHSARLQAAKAMNCTMVTLQATPMAVNFHQNMGFEKVSELNVFW
jgi:N-acetylglutamate synthase-like GNAT family acetyltransferase